MKKQTFDEGVLKAVIGWLVVFCVRLIPWRAPNVEGVMATLMPFGKRYGKVQAFVYGALSIALYDEVMGKVGSWTALTAISYGLVGVGAGWFFKAREGSRLNYVKFSIVATILYDAVTGLSVGPLFFHQPFVDAFLGQIPFTLWHLLGNALFAVVVSPLFYKWIVTNRALETRAVFGQTIKT